MPKFWTFLSRHWLGLQSDLAYTWWHALNKSRWQESTAFRTAVEHYDQHPYPGQRPQADKDLMSSLVGPQYLMQIVEGLVHERVLLRREAAKIEDAILAKLDAAGAWK